MHILAGQYIMVLKNLIMGAGLITYLLLVYAYIVCMTMMTIALLLVMLKSVIL